MNSNNNNNMHSKLYLLYKPNNIIVIYNTLIHTLMIIISLLSISYFKNSILSLITIPLNSLMMLRSLIIFHDCCHDSYSECIMSNYLLSFYYGLFAFLNVNWKFIHKTHHLTNGHINNEYNYQFNETIQHINFYKNLTPLHRQIYKIWKPFSYFATIIEIMLIQRFSIYGLMINSYITKSKSIITVPLWKIFFNDIISNYLLYKWIYNIYINDIIYHYLISCIIYGLLAIGIFHNQHTFNPSFVEREKLWNYEKSAINGSSIILVPYYLQYFTGNIQYHHLHHLNSKIPSYYVKKYHDDVKLYSNEFDNVVILSIKQCFDNLKLVLYSEQQKKYVTFDEADKELINDKLIKDNNAINKKLQSQLKKPTKYLIKKLI